MKIDDSELKVVRKDSRLLICGGRDRDVEVWGRAVNSAIVSTDPDLVICGDATGIDACVAAACSRLGVALCIWPAHWKAHGKSAGPIRNRWMLVYAKPDYVIAFPGGVGTENMVKQAEDSDVPVIRIKEVA